MMIGGSHLLNALGVNAGLVLGRLERFEQQVRNLQTLALDFGATAGHMGPSALAQMLQMGGIPPAAHMGAPPWGNCACPSRYAMPRSFDFGAAPGHHPFSLPALFARRQGAMLEQLLNQNPFARAQAEMMLGGRILPDGLADGRITVQPFAPGFFPAGGAGNLAAAHAMNALNQIQQAAYQSGFGAGAAAGMTAGTMAGYNDMVLGALGNLVGQMMNGGAAGTAGTAGSAGNGNRINWFDDPFDLRRDAQRAQQAAAGGANAGAAGTAGPGGVGGPGGLSPAGTTNGAASGAFGPGIGVEGYNGNPLNDPSLTVEDQVVMLLMMVAKRFDKQIKAQADYVKQIQERGGQGGDAAPSIDVEAMKLKRLVDKRGQMFDFLRQIVDKYNQTAKNMIDSIGR